MATVSAIRQAIEVEKLGDSEVSAQLGCTREFAARIRAAIAPTVEKKWRGAR